MTNQDFPPNATGAIIQIRTSSKRLPAKALKLIGGFPVYELIGRRLREAATLDCIVFATSNDSTDDQLAESISAAGYATMRGNLLDVYARTLDAAEKFGLKTVVRIPGDKPLVDPGIVDFVVQRHRVKQSDYTANFSRTHPDTLWIPRGFEVEVVETSALRGLAQANLTQPEREHVTLAFRRMRSVSIHFCSVYQWTTGHSLHNLSLDSAQDLQVIRDVVASLGTKVRIAEVISYLTRTNFPLCAQGLTPSSG